MALVLTSPGGNPRPLTISATPGNVVTNLTPGTMKRWVILYGEITLAAAAGGAARQIIPSVTDGTDELTAFQRSANVAATETRTWNFNKSVGGQGAGATSNGGVSNLPDDLIIEGDDQFRLTVSNGAAGDSYEGFMRVMELGITP